MISPITSPTIDNVAQAFRVMVTSPVGAAPAPFAVETGRQADPALVVEAIQLVMSEFDPTLLAHGRRTARYATSLGKAMGLSWRELRDIHFAGLFHDLGMLTRPARGQSMGGCLSSDEYALVQCHPRAGAALLEPFPFLASPALFIAHHHERWDGYGYPYGLRGELIPLGARILSVADCFDVLHPEIRAMHPHTTEQALRLLATLSGTQLDPSLVAIFAALMSRQVGTRHGTIPAPVNESALLPDLFTGHRSAGCLLPMNGSSCDRCD
jgi:HD-GYP domain-containing protein (c-di-GMP phosphodiesterase class II)